MTMVFYENSTAFRLAEISALAAALVAICTATPPGAYLDAQVWPFKERQQQLNFLAICDELIRKLTVAQ